METGTSFYSVAKSKDRSLFKSVVSPFVSLMDWYTESKRHINFDKVCRGYDLPMETLEEVFEFRNYHYKKVAPYLTTKNIEDIHNERWLDLNAFHVISRDENGKINGVLRLLSRPFECRNQNVQDHVDLTPYTNFLEISRCVVEQKKGVGKMILIRAGVWAITVTSFKGFIAICRESKLPIFKSFGLMMAKKFVLESRQGEQYYFIQSTFKGIVLTTMGRQFRRLFAWA